MRYLGHRGRCAAEVENYLRHHGVTDTVIDATLEKLRRLSYIDDEAFARNWALSRVQNQGYGAQRIEQELKAKGVGDSAIHAVIREIFAQENEEERARKILAKRFMHENLEEPRTLRRAAAFLQRRGYSSKVIFELLRYPIDNTC